MNIYLDEKKLSSKLNFMSLDEITNTIKNNLEDRIVQEVILNGIKMNEEEFYQKNIEKNDIKTLKFVTKEIDTLIEETLLEVDQYVPKLKDGIVETANLFRENEMKKANEKYSLILEGLDWYIDVINKITNIIGNEKLLKKVISDNRSLNKYLEEIKSAYEKNDIVLVADILEYEIQDIIERYEEYKNSIFD